MTTEEATWLRDEIVKRLAGCPPEAIARLLTSDPAENVMMQIVAHLVTPSGRVDLALVLCHAENAPQSDGAPIPAEHYAEVARRGGGAFD